MTYSPSVWKIFTNWKLKWTQKQMIHHVVICEKFKMEIKVDSKANDQISFNMILVGHKLTEVQHSKTAPNSGMPCPVVSAITTENYYVLPVVQGGTRVGISGPTPCL